MRVNGHIWRNFIIWKSRCNLILQSIVKQFNFKDILISKRAKISKILVWDLLSIKIQKLYCKMPSMPVWSLSNPSPSSLLKQVYTINPTKICRRATFEPRWSISLMLISHHDLKKPTQETLLPKSGRSGGDPERDQKWSLKQKSLSPRRLTRIFWY